jgi:hypothetical protein
VYRDPKPYMPDHMPFPPKETEVGGKLFVMPARLGATAQPIRTALPMLAPKLYPRVPTSTNPKLWTSYPYYDTCRGAFIWDCNGGDPEWRRKKLYQMCPNGQFALSASILREAQFLHDDAERRHASPFFYYAGGDGTDSGGDASSCGGDKANGNPANASSTTSAADGAKASSNTAAVNATSINVNDLPAPEVKRFAPQYVFNETTFSTTWHWRKQHKYNALLNNEARRMPPHFRWADLPISFRNYVEDEEQSGEGGAKCAEIASFAAEHLVRLAWESRA